MDQLFYRCLGLYLRFRHPSGRPAFRQGQLTAAAWRGDRRECARLLALGAHPEENIGTAEAPFTPRLAAELRGDQELVRLLNGA